MNLVAGLIPLFTALILAAVIITLVRRNPKGATSRMPARPANDDPAFIPGLIAGQTLFDQVNTPPHSHPHASSPSPHAFPSGETAHHTFPDHSHHHDTSSPSHDSGSFDGGSNHSHH